MPAAARLPSIPHFCGRGVPRVGRLRRGPLQVERPEPREAIIIDELGGHPQAENAPLTAKPPTFRTSSCCHPCKASGSSRH